MNRVLDLKSEDLKLGWIRAAILLAVGVLPSLIALVFAPREPAGGLLREAGGALLGQPESLVILTLCNGLYFAATLAMGVLCFLQFTETGRINKPVLGLPLLAGGVMSLATVGFMLPGSGVKADADMIYCAQVVTDNLTYLYLFILPTIFIFAKNLHGAKSLRQAFRWTLGIAIVLFAVSAGVVRSVTLNPEAREFLLAAPMAGPIFRWLPVVLILLVALTVLPVYARMHESIFAKSLLIACLPLGLASIHLALAGGGLHGFHFLAGHSAKLIGLMIPVAGLIMEYRMAYRMMGQANQTMRQAAFVSEQANEIAQNQERLLSYLMDHLPNPVCIFDASYRLLQVNRAARDLAVEPENIVRHQKASRVFPEKMAATLVQAAKDILRQPGTELSAESEPEQGKEAVSWSFQAFQGSDGSWMGSIAIGTVKKS